GDPDRCAEHHARGRAGVAAERRGRDRGRVRRPRGGHRAVAEGREGPHGARAGRVHRLRGDRSRGVTPGGLRHPL
ncbi:MAG: putative ATP-binding protein, partial [uncultured Quadrisphaera sp.]